MGETLKETGEQYQETKDKAKLTNELIWEYDQLSQKIGSSADSSEELAAQQERMEEITKKLQELHPTTISQYDIENGKLREKAGLAKEIVDADEKLAKLQLEKEIAEAEQKLPDTSNLIQDLEKQVAAAEAQNDAISEAIPKFKEYSEQFERLMMMPGTEEQKKQIDELVQKAKEAGEAVGIFINNSTDLNGLDSYSKQLASEQVIALESLITSSKELENTKQSYQELYDKQRKLIELNLGGTLGEYAQKFGSLADEGKLKFNESVTAAKNLNDQMSLIPSEKKINIEFLYKHTGQYVPEASKNVTDITNSLLPKQFRMDQYAEGGIATKPSIFGEAGPEIAIPINNKQRSRSLLDMANDLMGYNSNSGETVIQVNNAPAITIPGVDPSIMQSVNDAIKQANNALERRLNEIVQQQRRVSFQ
ncbi:hypothetical protein BJP46_31280 [Paenibacillus odorifer]|nr:hypothetical protein BJP46_31280 [Paenibacillus odorifer]